MRRPTWRSRSSVALSAQCTSSTTSTVGPCAVGQLLEDGREHLARVVRWPARWPAVPRTRRTASRSGPSARGVSRSSQAPASTRATRGDRMKARTRLVFPIPASPETSTTDPAPPAARSSAASSTRSSLSRSSRRGATGSSCQATPGYGGNGASWRLDTPMGAARDTLRPVAPWRGPPDRMSSAPRAAPPLWRCHAARRRHRAAPSCPEPHTRRTPTARTSPTRRTRRPV